jgi:serine/threonine protein kinase
MSEQAHPRLGAELGDYLLERQLGQGGMGTVFFAQDLKLRRAVAVKLLRSDLLGDTHARARFQREIETAVAVEHPHVVPVYDAGIEDGEFYIAMRYVAGDDLDRIIKRGGPLSEERAMRLLGQIASALFAVHARGLVHRDVKPANVLIWHEGELDEHAMLTDFGIAKALDDVGTISGGAGVGTPAYMAPEVCAGDAAGAASDQYSLAVMAFQMLCGRRPFECETTAEYVAAHQSQAAPALSDFMPTVSDGVAHAIARGLAKAPADRFADIRGLVNVTRAGTQSFDRSQAMTRVLAAGYTEQTVSALAATFNLTDSTIAQLTDTERARVMRLRRRAARRALVGES